MAEAVEVGDTGCGEFDVVFAQRLAVEFRDVGREEVEGVDAGELGFDDGFGLERGGEG